MQQTLKAAAVLLALGWMGWPSKPTEPACACAIRMEVEPSPLHSAFQRSVKETVLVDAGTVTDEKVAGWKKEGFTAVAVVLDDSIEKPALEAAAQSTAKHGLEIQAWIEVARHERTAKEHPDWVASLGMHDDWLKRFPKAKKPGNGEVAKAWPWAPIGFQAAFDAHLDRVKGLIAKVPAEYRLVMLNDLQGGPSACGCGNLQCRWAIDYRVPSTTAKTDGSPAAKFVAAVAKAAPGKEIVPVWTTECEKEDLPPAKQDPKGGASTGLCGDVDCFGTCSKRFAEQWSALHEIHRGATGLLLLQKEFQRDSHDHGPAGQWFDRALAFIDGPADKRFPRERLVLVVQGYDVTKADENAARAAAAKLEPNSVVVARTRIDQTYEPRIVKAK
jgi:hypothetical protein